MGVKYEVVAVTGEYQNRDGQTKKRYQKLGVVLETKNGMMLKLEATPLQWDGFAYLNEPDDKPKSAAKQRGGGVADMSDDIPFSRRGFHE